MTYPAPSPSTRAPTRRTGRPVRVWDIVLTVLLLLLLAVFAALASYFGLFLGMASDGCFDDNCDYGMLSFGVWFAAISPWVILLLAIVGAVTLLIVRRLAFWVPLTAAALNVVIFFVAAAIVEAAVGP
ncbi:DUF6264 family protein [Microbacterium lushaniae]|uniref:Uncharacterized protein n=1 Tax=Microbacterium lushaniae TaxID=2614639 RepID=A0A5J6L6R1_9MICO|nr:DUF6264 family protein [Microbacterium lushaniae]QEW04126.1 hypothetical protein F6J85_14205 [Microbacterium lushaniae]